MGKRNSNRKNAAAAAAAAMALDSDDADSFSTTSSVRSDLMSTSGAGANEEVEKDDLLDQCLDALYEKRGSTREKALESIIEAFNSNMQYEFVENNFVTLLHQCINSIKRGSAKEISLASHAIGLLALTTGCGNKAQEILEEAITPISQALKSRSEPSKIASLLECLAIITFIGGNGVEETEKSMQIMWEVVHPKAGPNVVASKPSPAVIAAMVSAWAFLLTTVDSWSLGIKQWIEFISYFSSLLDKEDRTIRMAAGEALALVFEIGNFERFSWEGKATGDGANKDSEKPREGYVHLQGLKGKVLNQVKNLAAEAGGKGTAKKDLNSQRNLFREILDFLEDGYSPETSVKIGGETLATSSWSEHIQLNFTKHFLRGGFVKHMQENEFLHELFGFTPKKMTEPLDEEQASEKKLHKKRMKNIVDKARTQYLNKQRMMNKDRKAGHFAVGDED